MENDSIKVALVRGDSLNEWEGKLWKDLPGVDVTAFCSKKNLFDPKNAGFPMARLRSSTDNFFVRQTRKFLRGEFQRMNGLETELENFDIAHTAEISYFYTLQAIKAKRQNSKLKVAVTVWDNSFGRFEYNYWGRFTPPRFWRNKVNHIIEENIRGADILLPVSEYSKEMLLSLGVESKKIRVLTPGVVVEGETQNVSDILALISGRKAYLAINRLVKEKGVYDLLYAWKIFSAKDKNSVLVVVGSGREGENIKRLAGDFNLTDSVIFIPGLPNQKIRNLLKHVHALVLASIPTFMWQEQFGYVLAEAIINDCPVISTYSGAIPEVVGSAGLLVPPAHPVELAKALLEMSDQKVRAKFAEQCGAEKQRFSAEVFRNKLVGIYKELIG